MMISVRKMQVVAVAPISVAEQVPPLVLSSTVFILIIN